MTKQAVSFFQPITLLLSTLSLCLVTPDARADDLTTGNRFGYQQEEMPSFTERVRQFFSTQNASATASAASNSATHSLSVGVTAVKQSAINQAYDTADTAEELYTDYVDPKNYLGDIERTDQEYRSWFTKSVLQASDDASKWSDEVANELAKKLK